MARPVLSLQLNGKRVRALFDTGSLRSHIRADLSLGLKRMSLPRPVRVGLGGKERMLRDYRIAIVKLDGLPFEVKLFPLRAIGTDDLRNEIDMIVGALTMEEYGLVPDPRTGKVGSEKLRKREFTEYPAL